MLVQSYSGSSAAAAEPNPRSRSTPVEPRGGLLAGLFYLLVLGVVITPMSIATEMKVFTSGPEQTQLLELFSSEGCSSCPPADRWLSRLREDPDLWTEFVPVSFQVDYWDSLGWKDPLASADFSNRQRAYAAAWGSNRVYTPGFVLVGEEWRGFFNGDEIPESTASPAGRLEVMHAAADRYLIAYQPPDGGGNKWTVHAALLGFGVMTDVKAGENDGRQLRHDFVVLRFAQKDLKREDDGRMTSEFTLPHRKEVPAERHGVAVWVTSEGDVTPIQAVGGYLSNSF